MVDPLIVMVQWILIFLQVIFANKIMIRLKIDQYSDFLKKKEKLNKIKLFVIIASVIEGVLMGSQILYFDVRELSQRGSICNNGNVGKSDSETVKLVFRFLTSIATILSISVDLIMYPMFISTISYFLKQHKLKQEGQFLTSRQLCDGDENIHAKLMRSSKKLPLRK